MRRVRPVLAGIVVAAVEHKGDATLGQQRANRCAVPISKTVIENGSGNVWMPCQLQGMRELSGREDVGSGAFQTLSQIERDQGFVFHDKKRRAREWQILHWIPRAHLRDVLAHLRGE